MSDINKPFKEEVDTIIFRDEYVVIVTTKKTYTLKYTDMGDISMGWLDNIQSCGLSAAKYPNQRKEHFTKR
jgi:hypothetical protein